MITVVPLLFIWKDALMRTDIRCNYNGCRRPCLLRVLHDHSGRILREFFLMPCTDRHFSEKRGIAIFVPVNVFDLLLRL